MILVLLALLAIGNASCTISSVITCALTHVDTNHDGFIDASEIDTFIAENPCNARVMRTSGTKVVSMCDRNSDNKLDANDANHGSSCLTNTGVLNLACSICESCQ